METRQGRLIGRPHWSRRAAAATVAPVSAGLGALGLYEGNLLLGLPLALLGVFAASELWRKVTIDEGHLIAQGRWSRRRVDLRNIVQVAVSPMAYPWVETDAGEAFYLGMVSRESTPGDRTVSNPGVWAFPDLLRERAVAAGANLGPRAEETMAPPPGVARLFGL